MEIAPNIFEDFSVTCQHIRFPSPENARLLNVTDCVASLNLVLS